MSKLSTTLSKLIPLLLLGLLVFGVVMVTGLGFHWNAVKRNPTQPIAYSHQIHVEELELECTHCHQYADRSPRAGIPAMAICMECHESVATDKPEIQKLTAYWNNKEPVPWVKVHRQPRHVYFTHKRHIKAGIQCVYCHGEVRAMTVARRVRSLEMGWCVTCHRQHNAPTDCLICHK